MNKRNRELTPTASLDKFTGRGSVPILEAYVINTDDRIEEVRPANGKDFSVEEIQRFVKGHFQIMWLKGRRFMALNEDGKIEHLPLNAVATEMLRTETDPPAMASDYVVGVALVCPQRMIN